MWARLTATATRVLCSSEPKSGRSTHISRPPLAAIAQLPGYGLAGASCARVGGLEAMATRMVDEVLNAGRITRHWM